MEIQIMSTNNKMPKEIKVWIKAVDEEERVLINDLKIEDPKGKWKYTKPSSLGVARNGEKLLLTKQAAFQMQYAFCDFPENYSYEVVEAL
jgi:hypothetical protein